MQKALLRTAVQELLYTAALGAAVVLTQCVGVGAHCAGGVQCALSSAGEASQTLARVQLQPPSPSSVWQVPYFSLLRSQKYKQCVIIYLHHHVLIFKRFYSAPSWTILENIGR